MTLDNVLLYRLDLWLLWLIFYCISPHKFQLHCLEKNGRQITKMVSYCAYHRYRNLISEIASSFSCFLYHSCFFPNTSGAMGSICGSGWPKTLMSIFTRNCTCAVYSFRLLASVFMVSSSVQGSESRYCFDYTNSSRGIFCQKPSPK